MKQIFTAIAFCVFLPAISQQQPDKVIRISDDIGLVKITDHLYVHVSYKIMERWGRTSANGLIYTNGKKAFLFDTPWNDEQTKILIDWLKDSLNTRVTGFIPNHWHEDCMGGLAYIKSKKIRSYANQKTIEIAKEKGLPTPDSGFKDSLRLHLGKKEIFCYYPGAAHSLDNIVIWLPSEQTLFAGCVLKGLEFNNIGFTGDGDINEYPGTLNRILMKFPDARVVIPGHGSYGGIELIHHNIKLTTHK